MGSSRRPRLRTCPGGELKSRDKGNQGLEQSIMRDQHRSVLERAHRDHAVDGMALDLAAGSAGAQIMNERAKELRRDTTRYPVFGTAGKG